MTPLLKPVEAASLIGVSRSTLISLIGREDLPHLVIATGRNGRRILRFDSKELETWIRGRRNRQLVSLLKGDRYAHRAGGAR